MDIVHHALIGGAGFLGALDGDAPIAGVAFIAGSVFPDLDVLFMVFGKHYYLRHHQSITHSIFLAPVYALIISSSLWLLPEIDWAWSVYSGALMGLLLHITLDWFNTFRIALLTPVNQRRFSLDAVFFVDSVAWSLTALFYLLYLYFEYQAMLWLYPVLFTTYIVAKWRLRCWVSSKLQPLFAIPSSLNPFEFYILEKQGKAHVSYLFNVLTRSKSNWRVYHPFGDIYQNLAERSDVFKDMKRVARAFHIVDVQENTADITIHAADIAVRNYGGRFGHTALRFDLAGKLIHEVANI